MMTVERWYEYQKEYRKNGLAMESGAKRVSPEPQDSALTFWEKFKVIFSLMFVGALCLGLIVSNAYVAGVRSEINALNRQSAVLRGEIENLNVSIEKAVNIRIIEERAREELGMVFPSFNEIVFLDGDVRPPEDFSMRLRMFAGSNGEGPRSLAHLILEETE